MILAVLASDQQKEEIAASAFFRKHEVLFSENISLWSNHIADAFIDLGFEHPREQMEKLAKLLPKPVLLNSVTETIDQLHPDFIRFNGWPGFLKGNLLEAAARPEIQENSRNLFGEDLLFVADVPGFVSARIVAMIINEAFFTTDAGVADRASIDLAMKLGTGYPYGPFEWGERIGLQRVVQLLEKLYAENTLYELSKELKDSVAYQ